MRKLLLYVIVALAAVGVTSCLGSSVEDKFKDWRESNDEWFSQQKANKSFYTTVTAPWDVNAQVLMHWYNDTMLTRDNLRPYYTSSVWVKYRGVTKDDEPFDSSYLRTSPADSIFPCTLNSGVIEGWAVAVTRMHVGDSCRVVIPYSLGYGSYMMSSVVLPYTNLVFDIKLVDIVGYEKN